MFDEMAQSSNLKQPVFRPFESWKVPIEQGMHLETRLEAYGAVRAFRANRRSLNAVRHVTARANLHSVEFNSLLYSFSGHRKHFRHTSGRVRTERALLASDRTESIGINIVRARQTKQISGPRCNNRKGRACTTLIQSRPHKNRQRTDYTNSRPYSLDSQTQTAIRANGRELKALLKVPTGH